MTQAETEAAFMAFTKEVQERALRIMGLAANQLHEEVSAFALQLADRAADVRSQYEMQQEDVGADHYDLAAQHVEPGTMTNSETGFEDRG